MALGSPKKLAKSKVRKSSVDLLGRSLEGKIARKKAIAAGRKKRAMQKFKAK